MRGPNPLTVTPLTVTPPTVIEAAIRYLAGEPVGREPAGGSRRSPLYNPGRRPRVALLKERLWARRAPVLREPRRQTAR
jgi:hypothetical protein